MTSKHSIADESLYDDASSTWQHADGRRSYEARKRNKLVRRRLIRTGAQNLPIRILFAALQLILAFVVILTIWSSWAFIYQRDIADPTSNPINGAKWKAPEYRRSLAASSEFLSTMIQTVIFHFPDEHLRAEINDLLFDLAKKSSFIQRRFFVHFAELQLKPEISEPRVEGRKLTEPVYQNLTPFTFIPKLVDIATGDFEMLVLGKMEHAKAVATIASGRFEVSNITAAMSLTCKFPTGNQPMETFKMRFDRILKAVENPSPRIRLLLTVLNALFRWIDTSFEPIPVTPAEVVKLERLENFLDHEQSKRFQQGYEPLVSEDKRSPKAKYLDTIKQLAADQSRCRRGSEKVPISYRRDTEGIELPSVIAELTLLELQEQMKMWRTLWKGALQTFVLNKKMQTLFTRTITEICESWLTSLSLGLIVYKFEFGIDSAEDGPSITMSAAQPVDPFTYAVSCSWALPKSKLSFGLQGPSNTSFLKIDISKLKLVFNATIHVPHPMLVDRSFISFSFAHDPVVDFDLSVDASKSHIFQAGLWTVDPFIRFTSKYALKPFLLKWVERFLQMITSPGKIHIPWFDKPTEFVCSRIEAESSFSLLRSKISTFW